MPATLLAERTAPWIGRIEPLDESSCLLTTGAARVEDLAALLGSLGADFEVDGPPELVVELQVLARRYPSATSASDPRRP